MCFSSNEIEIWEAVAKRINERKESLENYSKLVDKKSSGIEGWLKVETVAALKSISKIERVIPQNEGPDLKIIFHSGEKQLLELKAHNSEHFPWCSDWIGGRKENLEEAPCLFLQKKGKLFERGLERAKKKGFITEHKDIGGNWVIGLMKLKKAKA